MEIPYCRFDNFTSRGPSRDWGIKHVSPDISTATGLLRRFNHYCNVTFDNQLPKGFRAAYGGFSWETGYLLCVTVPSKDHHRRPSLLIIGLFLKTHSSLRHFLEHFHPRATIAPLLAGKTPANLTAAGTGRLPLLPGDFPQRSGADSFLELALFTETHAEGCLRFLHDAADGVSTLPSLLGITSTLDLSRFQSFDVVWCKPNDETSRRALARYIEQERCRTAPSKPSKQVTVEQSDSSPPPEPVRIPIRLAFVIVLLFATLLFVSRRPIQEAVFTLFHGHAGLLDEQDVALTPWHTEDVRCTLLDTKASLQMIPLDTQRDELKVWHVLTEVPLVQAYDQDRQLMVLTVRSLFDAKQAFLAIDIDHFFLLKHGELEADERTRFAKKALSLVRLIGSPGNDELLRLKSYFPREFESNEEPLAVMVEAMITLNAIHRNIEREQRAETLR